MKRLVLQPHFDDAVLSCYSALLPTAERPAIPTTQIEVLTVCGGIPGRYVPATPWDTDCGLGAPRHAVLERRREDELATPAGAHRTVLDFLDSQYVLRRSRRDTAALLETLTGAIGSATTVWIPAAIGGHPDHQWVRDTALTAVASLDRAPITRLYEDLPYAAMGPRHDSDGMWIAVAMSDLLLRKKMVSLAHYESQLRGFHVSGASAFLAREHLGLERYRLTA